MNFRLKEINGTPQAVFEDIDEQRMMLLSYFLHAAPHFVADVLYELSLVERHVIEFSGFETDLVDAQFFRDRVVIKSQSNNVTEREPLDFVLSVDEAKLLLLEWGVEIQRWRMEHHKTES